MLSDRERQFIEAAKKGNLKLVKQLVENEAIDIDCALERAPLEQKKNGEAYAEFKARTSPTYRTALSQSIIHKHDEVFDYLIAQGATIKKTSKWFRYDHDSKEVFHSEYDRVSLCNF